MSSTVRTRMAHGRFCTCRLCIEQYGPIPPPPPGRDRCPGGECDR